MSEKDEEKEYVVCVRYKAHCSQDAMEKMRELLRGDIGFVMVESVEERYVHEG